MYMLSQMKSFQNSFDLFCHIFYCILSMLMLKSQAMAKQSNSEAIVDNSSVNFSAKAGEYFGGLQTISKMRQAPFNTIP